MPTRNCCQEEPLIRHGHRADVFTKALFIFPYSWLRSRVAIIPDDLELGWLQQVLGFLIVDHSYYWWVSGIAGACPGSLGPGAWS